MLRLKSIEKRLQYYITWDHKLDKWEGGWGESGGKVKEKSEAAGWGSSGY